MQSAHYLLLGLLHLLDKSLHPPTASLLRPFNFALSRFDPTKRNRKVHRHKEMLSVIHERNGIGDILLVAHFVVLCILVESGFVFADDRLMLILSLVYGSPDEWELEVAAGRKADTDQC